MLQTIGAKEKNSLRRLLGVDELGSWEFVSGGPKSLIKASFNDNQSLAQFGDGRATDFNKRTAGR
jgi:hypothetical protein